MTKDELRARRLRLGMTQKQLAVFLGVDRMTVYRWERGTQPVPLMAERALQSLETPP